MVWAFGTDSRRINMYALQPNGLSIIHAYCVSLPCQQVHPVVTALGVVKIWTLFGCCCDWMSLGEKSENIVQQAMYHSLDWQACRLRTFDETWKTKKIRLSRGLFFPICPKNHQWDHEIPLQTHAFLSSDSHVYMTVNTRLYAYVDLSVDWMAQSQYCYWTFQAIAIQVALAPKVAMLAFARMHPQQWQGMFADLDFTCDSKFWRWFWMDCPKFSLGRN